MTPGLLLDWILTVPLPGPPHLHSSNDLFTCTTAPTLNRLQSAADPRGLPGAGGAARNLPRICKCDDITLGPENSLSASFPVICRGVVPVPMRVRHDGPKPARSKHELALSHSGDSCTKVRGPSMTMTCTVRAFLHAQPAGIKWPVVRSRTPQRGLVLWIGDRRNQSILDALRRHGRHIKTRATGKCTSRCLSCPTMHQEEVV